MPDVANPDCPDCGGVGVISIDELHVRECKCALKRSIQRHLGPEICAANAVSASPLFVYDKEGAHSDLTKQNLVIRGYWADVLRHFKWAFAAKDFVTEGLFFRFTVLTDERLRTVYVGAESYASRARSKRDDMQTFNTLADIVGANYDLVIIRLGHLGYKNVAMPGILKETLMLREVALKPTWLIDTPQSPFCPGHFAYSEDVYEYISNRYKVVEISQFDEEREEAVAPQGYAEEPTAVEEVSPGEEATPEGFGERAPAIVRRPPPPSLVSTLNLEMPGDNKSKTKNKYGKKKFSSRRGDE